MQKKEMIKANIAAIAIALAIGSLAGACHYYSAYQGRVVVDIVNANDAPDR